MGADSKSASNSTSQEYSDSFNTNVTQSVGTQGFGIQAQGNVDANGAAYNYDSGNFSSSSNYDYNLGAGGTAGGNSAGGTPAASDIDWASLLPWLIGGVGIFLIFFLIKRQ